MGSGLLQPLVGGWCALLALILLAGVNWYLIVSLACISPGVTEKIFLF